jgi:lipoate-protein ligase B
MSVALSLPYQEEADEAEEAEEEEEEEEVAEEAEEAEEEAEAEEEEEDEEDEILKSQHPSVFTTESHYKKYFFFKELVP